MEFCQICPTHFLDSIVGDGRPAHLMLAHLILEDTPESQKYTDYYKRQTGIKILDNSAFELWKQGKPLLDPEDVIAAGKLVGATHIVLKDYPNKYWKKTTIEATNIISKFHQAGFSTVFVPQSEKGDLEGLIQSFMWYKKHFNRLFVDCSPGSTNRNLLDPILAFSIIAAPNAYGVEAGGEHKLQRYMARYKLMWELYDRGFRVPQKCRVHFLGMVDGPNEIQLMAGAPFKIDTWDSSAACWNGINDREFDDSPTGLIDGKLETHVNFDLNPSTWPFKDGINSVLKARRNIDYIDSLALAYTAYRDNFVSYKE